MTTNVHPEVLKIHWIGNGEQGREKSNSITE